MQMHRLFVATVRATSVAMLFSFIPFFGISAQTSMLDYTFGDSGTVRMAFNGSGGYYDWANGVAIQPDGKIVVAGYSSSPGPLVKFSVARFDTNGTIDSFFGSNGSASLSISGGDGTGDNGQCVVLQPDGKILVGGYSFISMYSGVQFAVARFNPDGSPDYTFGSGTATARVAIEGTSGLSEAYSIALQQDGKIVLGGYCESPPMHVTFALARFDSGGAIDNTFGTSGTVRTDMPSNRAYGYAVAIQPDGKIVLAGTDEIGFALVRYLSNGTVDSTFGVNGIEANQKCGGVRLDLAQGVAIDAGGRIVASGRGLDSLYHSGFVAARYKSDGTPDSAFAGTGGQLAFISGAGSGNGFGTNLVLQTDGKIVVVGTSYDSLSHGDFGVARFDTTGALDNSFGNGGTTRNPIIGGTGFSDGAWSVAVQKDGKIVAAGSSRDSSNNTVFAVARYLSHNPALAVNEGKAPVPSAFRLFQNYPNPFNPTTTIEYSIGAVGSTKVRLVVYDILGREVSTLVNENKPAGNYSVRFDGSHLASGVYFYRLNAGNYAGTKKFVLLK